MAIFTQMRVSQLIPSFLFYTGTFSLHGRFYNKQGFWPAKSATAILKITFGDRSHCM